MRKIIRAPCFSHRNAVSAPIKYGADCSAPNLLSYLATLLRSGECSVYRSVVLRRKQLDILLVTAAGKSHYRRKRHYHGVPKNDR